MDVGLVSTSVSVASAVVAVAALVVTAREGHAVRRNTEFLAHRDQWWKRWSWVAERAVSDRADHRAVADLMALALETRPWTTPDDHWMFRALSDHFDDDHSRRDPDDLDDL